jgi:hypothetical protein
VSNRRGPQGVRPRDSGAWFKENAGVVSPYSVEHGQEADRGFEKGLLGMRAREQRRFTVPWGLAFGEEGKPPDVPPRTEVTFVVDLFRPAVSELSNGSPPANPARGGGGRGR